MNFTDVMRAVGAPVTGACHKGLGALTTAHRSQIICVDSRRLEGSIDVDACYAADPGHRHAHRWDYGIGYRTAEGEHRATWVEVHPASTGDVTTVLKKLDWMRVRIASWGDHAERLTGRPGPSHRPFVWLATASGRISINANATEARRLASAGLDLPKRKLRIP